MPAERPIVERLEEPLLEAVECCVLGDAPCILFVDWDYAEDWSGTYVRVIPSEALSGAPRIEVAEFWAIVRRAQGMNG